jgi:hypothetical protein
MSKILKKLTQFFAQGQMTGLEAYINSKNPSNTADVDRLSREYSEKFSYKGIL